MSHALLRRTAVVRSCARDETAHPFTIADEPSQVPLAERTSQIDKTSTAGAPKATSVEQQSVERPTTLQ